MKLYDMELSGNAYKVRLFAALVGGAVRPPLMAAVLAGQIHQSRLGIAQHQIAVFQHRHLRPGVQIDKRRLLMLAGGQIHRL